MSTGKRISRKIWIFLIVGVIVEILFDPLSFMKHLSENVEARIGLPIARARWEAQGITDYAFEVGTGLSGICIASAKVEVRGGRVVQVNLIDLLGTDMVSNDSLPPSKWANPYYPDQFFCDYANFTMPQLFDMVKRSSWSVSDITFDPNYGFISGVRFGQPDGRGVLNARISDCCSGFGIRNFQVLEE